MTQGFILVVAPQTLLRSFVEQLFVTNGTPVVTCSPLPGARALRGTRPKAVLVDLGDTDELTALGRVKRLRQLLPQTRIIGYTNCLDEGKLIRAICRGADVVLGPEASERDLLLAANS